MLEKLFSRRKSTSPEKLIPKSEKIDSNHIEIKEHNVGSLSFASATRGGTTKDGTPKENQDSVIIGKNHLAVADGMGGHEAAKKASGDAIKMFDYSFNDMNSLPIEELRKKGERFIHEVNKHMRRENAKEGLAHSGTTFTGATIDHIRDDGVAIGMLLHVGDSRAYILEQRGVLRQITVDEDVLLKIVTERSSEPKDLEGIRKQTLDIQHALDGLSQERAVQHLKKAYRFTNEEVDEYLDSSHMIYAALGEAVQEHPSIIPFELHPGETLMIQSDGLDRLTNKERKFIIDKGIDEGHIAEWLVKDAMEKVVNRRKAGEKVKDDDMTVAILRNNFSLE